MKNEEVIEEFKLCLESTSLVISDEACIVAIQSLKENAKLKSEIERLASDNAWLVLNKSEKEFENVDLIEEKDKLKAEIEQLLKLLKTSCDFCHYKCRHGNEEPCRSCKTYSNWKLKVSSNCIT